MLHSISIETEIYLYMHPIHELSLMIYLIAYLSLCFWRTNFQDVQKYVPRFIVLSILVCGYTVTTYIATFIHYDIYSTSQLRS